MGSRRERRGKGARPGGPSSKPGARTTASPWILGSWQDLLFVILTPLLLIPLIDGARAAWSAETVTAFVLIWSMGHHVPGMLRAYGDRELFLRYRTRFLVMPVLLLAVALGFGLAQLHGLILLTSLWGWWHYQAQAYGFARIYDSKVGAFAGPTIHLDRALVLVWFAGAVILNPNGLHNFLELFVETGFSLPGPAFFDVLRVVTALAIALVTLAFFANLTLQWRRGHASSPLKVLLLVLNLGYFWFSAASATHLLVAYALYEIFHDIQYLAIVWAFNRKQVEDGRPMGAVSRFVFQPALARLSIYLGLIFAYGLVYTGFKQLEPGSLQQSLIAVYAASTLLHYYYDGFIWRLREKDTRRSLAITATAGTVDGGANAPRAGNPKHMLLWVVFFAALLGTLFVDDGDVTIDLEGREQIHQAAPTSYLSLQKLGVELESAGRDEDARKLFEEAVAVAPDQAAGHFSLAALHQRRGEAGAAIRHYRRTLEADPRHAAAHYNWGLLLAGRNDLRGAIEHWGEAVRLDPTLADAHYNLGTAYWMQNKVDRAQAAFERVLAIQPDHAAAKDSLRRLTRSR